MTTWLAVAIGTALGLLVLAIYCYALSRLGAALGRSGARTTPSRDLHTAALPRLTEQAADNPRLVVLLAEIERGRTRNEGRP